MHTSHSRYQDVESLPGVVAGLVTVGVLTVAFGLLALGVPFFWVAFPIGFGGVLPLAVGLAKRREDADGRNRAGAAESGTGSDRALHRLRERYAAGELSDAAFERRLERLLATEDGIDQGIDSDAGIGPKRGRE
ncbi:SHOCT domain-containing protein [Haloarchaeobius amylolyticus]|uniref:SHOCT domain-containing protein n=1 Tax=Haloarchaeobius amylolyticus TaxID=1198296 RepID=UPI00226DB90D|nr:SHOCT domain-containing protein [Haloarchaeobius amylolyticus]